MTPFSPGNWFHPHILLHSEQDFFPPLPDHIPLSEHKHSSACAPLQSFTAGGVDEPSCCASSDPGGADSLKLHLMHKFLSAN